MAFDPTALVSASVSHDDITPRLWTYRSPDNLSTTVAADYFASTPQRLKAGDFIFMRTSEADSTIVAVKTATTEASAVNVLTTDD